MRQKFDLEEIARRLTEMRTYRKCNIRERDVDLREREGGRELCAKSKEGRSRSQTNRVDDRTNRPSDKLLCHIVNV